MLWVAGDITGIVVLVLNSFEMVTFQPNSFDITWVEGFLFMNCKDSNVIDADVGNSEVVTHIHHQVIIPAHFELCCFYFVAICVVF